MYIIYDGKSCIAFVTMVMAKLYSKFILCTCLKSMNGCYIGRVLSRMKTLGYFSPCLAYKAGSCFDVSIVSMCHGAGVKVGLIQYYRGFTSTT